MSEPSGSNPIHAVEPPGRIWLGLRYTGGRASCPFGIDGLYLDISGNDTLQALMLAARLLADRLSDFVETGGRIFHPRGPTTRSIWRRTSATVVDPGKVDHPDAVLDFQS